MRIILFIILLSLNLLAQNIWYVNGANTSGTYNGRSWATGWQYFDSSGWAGTNGINWAIIQPGDTIYVSGGVDSLTYTANTFYGFWITPDVRRDFRSGNPPVITRAWQPGHNGVVRLVATGGSNGQQGILRVRNINNIKIRGLVIEDRRTAGEVGHVMLGDYSDDSHYYFEDNHLIGRGNTTILHLGGHHITVRGNILEHLLNNNPADCDIITASGGGGSYTIDRNMLIQRNTNNETDAHRDMIQISNLYGSTSVTIPITISNNLIIAAGKEGSSWNNMIYNYGWDITPPVRLMIYNNIFVNEKYRSSVGGIAIGRLNNTFPIKLYVLNNTIINKGSGGTGSTAITCWGTDSIMIKNNIVVLDTFVNNLLNLDLTAGGGIPVGNINYNHYAELGGSVGNFNSISWTAWRAQGHDANSSVSNSTQVLFSNKYGENIVDYYTTTGRGAGENLYNQYPFLRYDILGNERPESGAWDMGALQYSTEIIDTIPNTYSFTPVTNAELNTLYTSNSNTLTGIDEGQVCTIWITGGEYQINSGSWTSSSGTIGLGDTFRVRRYSSTLYSTAVSATLYISNRSAAYTITTKAEPPPPTPSAGGWVKGSDGKHWKLSNGKRFLTKAQE